MASSPRVSIPLGIDSGKPLSAVDDARRKGLLGAGGRRAFVVEAMLLLAFLGFALALILQLFAASSNISKQAHADSTMHLLANNSMQAALVDAQLPDQQVLYFDEQGQACQEEDASYSVEVVVRTDDAEAGQMAHILVQVTPLGIADAQPFTINTQRYIPDDEARSTSGSKGVGA